MNSLPRRSSSAYVVIQTIAAHGPVTFDEGLQLHGTLGPYKSLTLRVYDSAVKAGLLVQHCGRYALTDRVKTWLAHLPSAPDKAQLVPPRVWDVWTPAMDMERYLRQLRAGFERRKGNSHE